MAVNNDALKKMLDDAGVSYGADATQVQLLELIATAIKPGSAPVVAADPVAPAEAAPVSAVDEGRSVVQAIIDQQKEEQKVKEMFDLTTKEGRWQNFLYNARKVNPVRFDAQFAAGEFDSIPATFEAPVGEKTVGTPMGSAS